MDSPSEVKACRYGSLTYTKPALAVLFFWLLWGDVCYTLMESVTTPIMQLKFKALDATNTQMALIVSTIPSAVYFTLNPIVSLKSDRYRSRWGRRLPFILCSMPFLVLALVGLAFGDRLGLWLHSGLRVERFSQNAVVIGTLAVLLILYHFFNIFVTTTFWYLFNDVVPEQLLARFMSWFRVVGTVSLAIYNSFVFPYSGSHSTEIFLGAAALYLVGFGLMCWNVREGTYGPPPLLVGGTGPVAVIKTFGKECHSHRVYWYLWLCTFIGCIGGGIGAFEIFFKQSIGLDLKQIGHMGSAMNVIVAVMVIGVGWLADRVQPIRVVLVAVALNLFVLMPANLLWIFWHPGPEAMWTLHLPFVGPAGVTIRQGYFVACALYVGLGAPIAALTTMWDPVMLMRTFPRSRFGQFCSMNAVWRTGGNMLGAFMAGIFFDVIGRWVGKDNVYFYGVAFNLCFAIPSFVFFVMFYRAWKKVGGKDYVAPVPGATSDPAAAELEMAATS